MSDSAADRLVDFLEEYVLRPGMSAIPEHYGAEQRVLLEDVEARLRAKLATYRACPSAADVIALYRSELDTKEGQELEHRQRVLNLPTFRQVHSAMDELAAKLKPKR